MRIALSLPPPQEIIAHGMRAAVPAKRPRTNRLHSMGGVRTTHVDRVEWSSRASNYDLGATCRLSRVGDGRNRRRRRRRLADEVDHANNRSITEKSRRYPRAINLAANCATHLLVMSSVSAMANEPPQAPRLSVSQPAHEPIRVKQDSISEEISQ